MNKVSIIINGVRYDAEPLRAPVTIECDCCDLYNKDGDSECLYLNRCPLFRGYVLKKSDKKFEQ